MICWILKSPLYGIEYQWFMLGDLARLLVGTTGCCSSLPTVELMFELLLIKYISSDVSDLVIDLTLLKVVQTEHYNMFLEIIRGLSLSSPL